VTKRPPLLAPLPIGLSLLVGWCRRLGPANPIEDRQPRQRRSTGYAIEPLPEEEAGDVVLSDHRRADHGPAKVECRLTASWPGKKEAPPPDGALDIT